MRVLHKVSSILIILMGIIATAVGYALDIWYTVTFFGAFTGVFAIMTFYDLWNGE